MWVEIKDGQRPRNGEIIAVKNESMEEDAVYPHLLIVKDNELRQLQRQSVLLSTHGLTHWQLIEGPY